jgi:xylulokinase
VFLGIDIGTFESKGVLVDTDGTVVAEARRRHGIETPHSGHVEQDAETVWWADLTDIARELTGHAAGSRIAGVGVSAIGPCVVPTDDDFRPLRPAILYGVDTRATAQIDRLTERLGPDEIFRRSGNSLTSQSAGPKIAWLRDEEPEVWQKARWFMTSQSYLVAKLTGEVTIDHATAGYFHPLYDLSAGAWNVTGCEDFVTEAQLPRIAWSTEIAGRITDASAVETGIPAGVPVIVGTTDAPAEAVGSGVVDEGQLMAMYGSSGYFIRVGDTLRTSPELWSAPFVFEGTFVLAAGTSTAGTATRWLADLLGLTREHDGLTFTGLVDLAAESVPGARGLLALPHLAGERTPFQDPFSRGVVMGLGLHHTRADFARAMLEGVGHSIAAAILAFRAADAPIASVTAIGGATKNPFIVGTVSSVTGLDQQVADTPGAAFGDAFLAAMGVGFFSEPTQVISWVRTRETVRPDDSTRATLTSDHEDYLALYRAIAPLQRAREGRA